MNQEINDFLRAAKDKGVDLTPSSIGVPVDVFALILDVHNETIRREIRRGHLKAFRRNNGSPYVIRLKEAARYACRGGGA